MRIGIGYDVHSLVEGRLLILGGVTVPFEQGLLGHSDADVLTHAIMDAMLGALALGDLGKYFPDNNPAYKDISSLKLLADVAQLCRQKGYKVANVDAVIIAQQPKLAPYITQMRENIAQAIGVAVDSIGVKATTTEGLGFCGTGQGMAAQAVALLVKIP
ncbi:MAG: 2-C-methyl-D-erythritol 2,4-cyclodiphosphate synthase [Firmicutes bacterium]|nr:2-C-methyl-D-erythritol 2,4-cyclodiphosphate synthase [Bacillota bacterium]